ncbi:hypothetical protein PHYSODRAFT_470369 [Phytophthora sojae]|uniref:Uncharacterized protein n=1 Tax=Phytophthora sojae (strain P6497) TaxID=1094619 RepID=G4YNS2_PHYSP|nr:hypothetical protein PHYSODRAFT_470369 [Phytophthora sojae]EGZ30577.1 hypothetical protein PHYSODRAFT_470369 [Phytophthora sojae]|eukprot:XP_009517852.1 hypothetical protein PHYSODRAFT_470369 [Phytophthora sojae]
MFSRSYPALAPLADPVARKKLQTCSAPAIAAGTPIDSDALTWAVIERKQREHWIGPGRVMRAERVAAIVREHAIMAEHIEAAYPMEAVAPIVKPEKMK